MQALAQPPGQKAHWLGTDPQGRDVLAGLLYGASTVCLVSVPAAIAATLLGSFLGSLAGYYGNRRLTIPAGPVLVLAAAGLFLFFFRITLTGLLLALFGGVGAWLVARRGLAAGARAAQWPVPVDKGVLLLIALLTSIPRLVLVLAIAAVQQPSIFAMLCILSLTYWPVSAQLVRAEMLRIRQLPYIEAAQALGVPSWQILVRHAFPALRNTIGGLLPLSVAALIGLETTLSFLGVGLPPQIASWGRLLATSRQDFTAWWLILFPASAILLTVLALRQLLFSFSKQTTRQ
ncbi:ABC transporter permease [Hymenobacter chitinivorans]|uniref:ABC transporter permease n=1 Tax=Hymenobacter chitinivorans TaxID=89969 RepID=UPI0012FD7710|nr:ABC transporter permease [Hymenobacter chitinivorans]